MKDDVAVAAGVVGVGRQAGAEGGRGGVAGAFDGAEGPAPGGVLDHAPGGEGARFEPAVGDGGDGCAGGGEGVVSCRCVSVGFQFHGGRGGRPFEAVMATWKLSRYCPVLVAWLAEMVDPQRVHW